MDTWVLKFGRGGAGSLGSPARCQRPRDGDHADPHIGGIATDHGATAGAAHSTSRALQDLTASGAADAIGGNGEQQTLRNAFPERYAVVTGRRTAAPEDVSNASASAPHTLQSL